MNEDLEVQLRGALRRRDPSAGFAERVMARSRAPERRFGVRFASLAAIAAMLAVGLLVNRGYQQRRAEEAHTQAMTALRITAEKLNLVRDKMLTRQARVKETENP